MQEYRTETTISQDGKLSIKDLPFRKGETVKVIIYKPEQKNIGKSYPLRGKPFTYSEPFNSVDEEEWESLK